ncbi:DDE-type integrase/transposase/recombinase [Mesorhizobium sp. M0910]|uniref:DDE-type integrase/transposase/recombinase n=1 Tax=Mesorhizobium sp. M0910 TaxID=2957025 RepID=UPI00333BE5A8
MDQQGTVLAEILQKRRDKAAAKRLLVTMKCYGFVPKRIVTDKLRSYTAAKTEVAPGLDHWSHKGLNNRTEPSAVSKKGNEPCKATDRRERCNVSSPYMHSATPRGFHAWKIAACRLKTKDASRFFRQRLNVTTPVLCLCASTTSRTAVERGRLLGVGGRHSEEATHPESIARVHGS